MKWTNILGLAQRAVENNLVWDPVLDVCQRGWAVVAVLQCVPGSKWLWRL